MLFLVILNNLSSLLTFSLLASLANNFSFIATYSFFIISMLLKQGFITQPSSMCASSLCYLFYLELLLFNSLFINFDHTI